MRPADPKFIFHLVLKARHPHEEFVIDSIPDFNSELFLCWRDARRGAQVAEDMTNPVWEWMFRGRVDPYQVNEWFQADEWQRASKTPRWSRWLRRLRSGRTRFPSFPESPRWAGCRMGQSRTKLPDGRIIWISGEHEDFYDPDFYIYNDVVVEHPDGRIQIVGYPSSVFRPTDFHTATLIKGGNEVLVIGNVGYTDDRQDGQTPVYRLDCASWQIEEIQTSGDCPGWIGKHRSTISEDGKQITLIGGKTWDEENYIENIDEWSLSLSSMQWKRVTERKWPRVQVRRTDEEMLILTELDFIAMQIRLPEMQQHSGIDHHQEFVEQHGFEPNLDVYQSLYVPSMDHQLIDSDSPPVQGEIDDEPDEEWNVKRLLIAGINVRIVDGHDNLTLTAEGDLPISLVMELAEELKRKLSILHQAEFQLKWIFPRP